MPEGKAGLAASFIDFLSSVTFIQFLFEEAAQTYQMALWVLMDAEEWEEADHMLDLLQEHVNRASFTTDTIGWLQPHTRGAFAHYWTAVRVQIRVYRTLLAKRRKPSKTLGDLRITSSPSEAKITINNTTLDLLTPETIRRLTPGLYEIELTKFDPRIREVRSARQTVAVRPGEKTEVFMVLL